MTNRTHFTIRNSWITRGLVALGGLAIAMSLPAQSQAHPIPAGVKERYDYQKRDLRKAYLAEGKSIRAAYSEGLRQAAFDRRVASKLCEPSRSLALAKIRAARLQAGECYREDLRLSKKGYQLQLAELEAWYASACRHAHQPVQTVVSVTPVATPRYIVKKTTTTYSVPAPVGAVVPHTVHTEAVQHPTEVVSPDYELIEPEVIEGPFFEGPVLESPSIEGPVLEGPQFEPGPVFEPSSALPLSSHVPGHQRVRTTTVSTARQPATVVVARPAAHVADVHGVHGHEVPAVNVTGQSRGRGTVVSKLVSHALRVLAQ